MKGRLIAMDWNETEEEFNDELRRSFPDSPESEIVSLDVHRTEVAEGHRAWIAASYRDHSVCVWTMEAGPHQSAEIVFKIQTDGSVMPRTVRVDHKSKDIHVFSHRDGQVIKLDPKTGIPCLYKHNGPSVMAAVDIDYHRERFVTCTERGFQLHQLGNLSHILSLESEPPIVSFAKHVAFVDNGNLVVTGTDAGKAVVYDAETGKRMQDLTYPGGGLVQPVTACDLQDISLIAMAGSTRTSADGSKVLVWTKKRTSNTVQVDSPSSTLGPSVHRFLDLVGLPSVTPHHRFTAAYTETISLPERKTVTHTEHIAVISSPTTSVIFMEQQPITEFVTKLQVVTTVVTELPPATTIRHVVTIRETYTAPSTPQSQPADPFAFTITVGGAEDTREVVRVPAQGNVEGQVVGGDLQQKDGGQETR
ncbi:hypothetical protein EUX98_g8637 [Antrodiella citrinella]|uniref:Anaphase-promoting complex subunit 4 WD40 domain-containing protein n=1 Tax=Antrodiella citrinella TaxID=2447956 RepID=A0A4S4M730_9APHY|nr:hypothetical protein EUX98_g8637 [Antrodiella citrinella]